MYYYNRPYNKPTKIRTEHQEAPHIGPKQSRETKKWLTTLQHFQDQGDIGQSVDLGFAVTLIGSISSTAALDPIVFIKKKKDLERYIEFCVELILTGLS